MNTLEVPLTLFQLESGWSLWWITGYVVGLVLSGIVGMLVQKTVDRYESKRDEKGSPLTGNWAQIVFPTNSPGENAEKVDFIVCKHKKDFIDARIERLYPFTPEQQDRADWAFRGRFSNGILHGYYYSMIPGDPSCGTIFLRQVNKNEFKGSYVRTQITSESWEKDAVSIEKIPLQWRRLSDDAVPERPAASTQSADVMIAALISQGEPKLLETERL